MKINNNYLINTISIYSDSLLSASQTHTHIWLPHNQQHNSNNRECIFYRVNLYSPNWKYNNCRRSIVNYPVLFNHHQSYNIKNFSTDLLYSKKHILNKSPPSIPKLHSYKLN